MENTPLKATLWLAILVVCSLVATLAFACATPFAAFAAAAAITLSRKKAFLLIGAVWFANQLVGFAVLNYPLDTATFGWGLIIGIAAVLATFSARFVFRKMQGNGYIIYASAFLAAFAVYEAVLLMASILAGDTEDYTTAILLRIFAINAVSFPMLLILNRAAIATGLSTAQPKQLHA